MFKKLFGGSQPQKPVQQPVQQQGPLPDKELQQERTMNNLRLQIDPMDQLIDNRTVRLEKLDAEIRTLVAQKKKGQAMTRLQEAKMIREDIQNMENKKHTMVKLKINLETAQEDASAVNVMRDVNNIMKDQAKINEELEDHYMDIKEAMESQDQAKNIWKNMAEEGTDQ